MSNRYNLSNISSITNKKVFFDANILIYLFWATGSSWERAYANLYSKLNNQNNTYVIDFLVISEFINRAIKIEYQNYLNNNDLTSQEYKYKEYRDSEEGQEVLGDIYTIISLDILEDFEVVEKSYSKDAINAMLLVDSLDFTDKAIEKICDENNCVLLTNDKDFKDSTIEILSCNRKLA